MRHGRRCLVMCNVMCSCAEGLRSLAVSTSCHGHHFAFPKWNKNLALPRRQHDAQRWSGWKKIEGKRRGLEEDEEFNKQVQHAVQTMPVEERPTQIAVSVRPPKTANKCSQVEE